MLSTNWIAPPSSPQLSGNQIHVWRIDISPKTDFQTALPLLTDSERERAGKFLADKHRSRFVLGRARMREVLALYSDQSPREVELAFENLGKPFFACETLNAKFQFNFSNTSELAVCAVTLHEPIGVDTERIREMSDMLGLAKRYFHDSETEELFQLPAAKQANAFFRLWTRKEAWLKAIGKGLTIPLRDVCVAIGDKDCRIHLINDDEQAAKEWDLIPFSPAEEHVGAIAIKRLENETAFYDLAK